MTKESNLSEKVKKSDYGARYVWETDIKEFIKRLKEEFEITHLEHPTGARMMLRKIIDKLAGDDLNG